MKNTKKKVFVVALVVCLLATISMGTLAWFSAQDSVENKFYVADSDDDTANEIFSVDVKETTPDGSGDDDGYEYTDILPGDTLTKEPHVINTGYYDQYVRVTVTISDAQAWVDALGANFDVTSVFEGFDATMWTHVWNNMNGATTVPQDIVYVLYYNGILDGSDTENDTTSGTISDITVFTGINIPTALDQADVAAFGGNFTIDVKAEAVQTENVVPAGTAAADAAWAAFQTVNP